MSHDLNYLNSFIFFIEISYEEATKLDSSYRHAAHAFICCKNNNKLWSLDLEANIFMQLRFDGHVGFPGGFIDPTDNSWEDGLNRELDEEINLDKKFYFGKENYLFTYVIDKVVLHFYGKQFSLDEYKQIENESFRSHDYGGEVMGVVKPPLFETNRGFGFSIFIRNQFIGCALMQLIRTMLYFRILPNDKLVKAISYDP